LATGLLDGAGLAFSTTGSAFSGTTLLAGVGFALVAGADSFSPFLLVL